MQTTINSLTYNKILDKFNVKVFADEKFDRTKKMKFVFHRVENIVREGENIGYQNVFPQCFQKLSRRKEIKMVTSIFPCFKMLPFLVLLKFPLV